MKPLPAADAQSGRRRRARRPHPRRAAGPLPLRDQRRPHLADPRAPARARHPADPHAPRAVVRLRRRRLRAHHAAGRACSRVTAGCGLTNAVTGLCVAGLTGSPVVCIAGPAPDHRGPARLVPGGVRRRDLPDVLQVHEARARLVDDRGRPAPGVPRGDEPAAGPGAGRDPDQRPLPAGRRRPAAARARASIAPDALRSAGDPAAIERALEVLAARRASAHRRRRRHLLVRRRRRAARVRRAHRRFRSTRAAPARARCPRTIRWPCAARGRSRSPDAPTCPRRSASGSGAASTSASRRRGTATRPTSRSTPTPARVGWHVPADVPIVGDPKLVPAPADRPRRGAAASTARAGASGAVARRGRPRCASSFERGAPRAGGRRTRGACRSIPRALTRDLLEVIDHDATLVIDSFTLSGWLSQWFAARFPGQIVDAGPLAPVGHGIGMGIGAQLARPGQAGRRRHRRRRPRHRRHGDRDRAQAPPADRARSSGTTARGGRASSRCRCCEGRADPFDMLPELRYDRMFEAIGCHGEHVERPTRSAPRSSARSPPGKAVGGERDRRPARRPRAPRRQPARLDRESADPDEGIASGGARG